MKRFDSRVPPALTALILAVVGCVCTGYGYGQNAVPAGNDLLLSRPFDRVTLVDGTVLIVEPIAPRPLPVIDPAKRRAQFKLKSPKIEIPLEGKVERPDDKDAESDDPASTIRIHIIQETDVRDFQFKRSSLKLIEYFEDLLMAEADRLVQAREFSRAFEHLLRVQARAPAWPGLDEHVNRLLFAEGGTAMLNGESDLGLRLLKELLARKRDFPGLLDQLGSAYGSWITRAIELGQYGKGRRFLHELSEMAPEHPVVRELRSKFTARASELVKRAGTLDIPGRLDALTEAVKIWPELEGAEAEYRKAFAAMPTLDVAVNDVPSPVGPWVRSPADSRLTRLLYRPILASDSEDARKGIVAGQLASALESSKLGRSLIIRLRQGINWSDGSRSVSVADVARALIDRTNPHSMRFNARWADLLDRVESRDETRVEIQLKRPLLKPGYWFDGPVGPAHAGFDGRVATGQDRLLVTDGDFRCLVSSDSAIELRCNLGDSASAGAAEAPSGRIVRLREVRLPGAGATMGALVRGEVGMAAHVPPDQLAMLAGIEGIKIGRYSQPSIHMIAIDGRNPALRNRSLRRGLSYAIDRKTILEESVLKRPVDAGNGPADGPFPKGSYVEAAGVKPLGYDPLLARMLVAAARKERNNDLIELSLDYPSIPEALIAVPLISEALGQAGVKIKTIEWSESQLEAGLRAGRKFDLAYRVVRSDEPLLDAGEILCPGYDAPAETEALASAASPRILQLLLQLERAVDLPTAKGLAVQIDRETRDELPVLPLWQLVDHFAWRTRLVGPPEVADQLYQGIEAWKIAPWIARDPWTSK